MKKFLNILIFVGIMGIWGTAGATDNGSISFMTAIRQILISGMMIFIGTYGKVIIDRITVSNKAEIIEFKSENVA